MWIFWEFLENLEYFPWFILVKDASSRMTSMSRSTKGSCGVSCVSRDGYISKGCVRRVSEMLEEEEKSNHSNDYEHY